MSKPLHRDLEELMRLLLAQSSLVEEVIQLASRAICEMRPELSDDILQRERRINEQEVRIEENCLKILALHQPVAIDLRRTATVLKINTDLERIADLAVNTAERAHTLATYPNFMVPDSFERMAASAVSMVSDALDAFVNLDARLAREVCRYDDEIDALNRELIGQMMELVRSDRKVVEPAFSMFSASRHVERIADHATNIAEDVIYLADGEIVRHRHDLEPGESKAAEPWRNNTY